MRWASPGRAGKEGFWAAAALPAALPPGRKFEGRRGRPGAGRGGWRGGAGRPRRRGAGVDPTAGPGHGGGAGGRPRRPGGERHVGGVRPAVGGRDGHPGECAGDGV